METYNFYAEVETCNQTAFLMCPSMLILWSHSDSGFDLSDYVIASTLDQWLSRRCHNDKALEKQIAQLLAAQKLCMIAQKCLTRHLKYAAGCDLREEHSGGGG